MKAATATREKITAATLPGYDFVEATLKQEFNRYAGYVEHYAEMESLATSEKGKNKWRFLRRMVQKLKDDMLAILYRYQERQSFRDLADAFNEAQEERRSLIKWIASRPQEDRGHMFRAADEIDALQELLTGILYHVKEANRGRTIAAEAAVVLATLPR